MSDWRARLETRRMQGSLRQRSAGSFELRVFVGVDPETRRKRYRSMTFRGNRAEAERELTAMITGVESERLVGARSPVSELLEGWFAVAAPGWSPTTVRQTGSVSNCYLLPGLGDIRVGDVTVTRINTLYATLAKTGSIKDGPSAAGTLARVHVVLRSAFSQRCAPVGYGTTRSNVPIGSRSRRSRCDRRHPAICIA